MFSASNMTYQKEKKKAILLSNPLLLVFDCEKNQRALSVSLYFNENQNIIS